MNVSRETSDKLEHYEATLRKWNPKINLVAKSTLADLRARHFEDSAQVFKRIPKETTRLVDLGSGGGFPGLVIAILAGERGYPLETVLIESDQRKSAFLRTVLREIETKATVITDRIEQAPPQNADIITARALADLPMLLAHCERHLNPEGRALFLKGRSWRSEVEDARKQWNFELDTIQSLTEPDAVLLEIEGAKRV
ncbi:16S rRNA (guanine(527)-N(7))-methyltransferase RsmG [Rhodobacteraceae bacterium 63075]|nr:16S rRNA (guanine(527)-N(7))-methyltransferase RsmG [Rhodobacteraceae bacterium 63075]